MSREPWSDVVVVKVSQSSRWLFPHRPDSALRANVRAQWASEPLPFWESASSADGGAIDYGVVLEAALVGGLVIRRRVGPVLTLSGLL
jgi:hypothetical protein